MSTLDKLRSLHMDVCWAWRRYSDPYISEGEAEIINAGFMLLEHIVQLGPNERCEPNALASLIKNEADVYTRRVHAQFDFDADIKIKSQ